MDSSVSSVELDSEAKGENRMNGSLFFFSVPRPAGEMPDGFSSRRMPAHYGAIGGALAGATMFSLSLWNFNQSADVRKICAAGPIFRMGRAMRYSAETVQRLCILKSSGRISELYICPLARMLSRGNFTQHADFFIDHSTSKTSLTTEFRARTFGAFSAWTFGLHWRRCFGQAEANIRPKICIPILWQQFAAVSDFYRVRNVIRIWSWVSD